MSMFIEKCNVIAPETEHEQYDEKRLYFTYLNKDQFEEVMKQKAEECGKDKLTDDEKETFVFGQIDLGNEYEGDYDEESEERELNVVKISDKRDKTGKLFEITETKKSHQSSSYGYIEVTIGDEIKYIRIRKGGFLFIWWWLLGAGCLFGAAAILMKLFMLNNTVIINLAFSDTPLFQYATWLTGGLSGILIGTGFKWRFGHTKSGAFKVVTGLTRFLALTPFLPVIAALTMFVVINVAVPMGYEHSITGIENLEHTGQTAPQKDPNSLEYADGDDWDGSLEERHEGQDMSEYIEIAGYTNLLVSESYQTIRLINTDKNTVYQQYEIYFGDEFLFDSKLIAPGKQLEWNAWEALPAGHHELTFQINCYDVETKTACNGAVQSVTIDVEK